MPRNLYSPRLSDDVIRALYREGLRRRMPMTRLADELLRLALADVPLLVVVPCVAEDPDSLPHPHRPRCGLNADANPYHQQRKRPGTTPGLFRFQTSSSMQAPVYHYTTGDRLLGILAAGEIRPATTHVAPPEIPAVWLSSASVWEQSATKGVIVNGVRRQASLPELVLICGCLARIEIDPTRVVLIPRHQLQTELHIPDPVFRRLLGAGAEMGADPDEWLAVASAIPLSAIRRVEIAFETRPIRWVEARPCGVHVARTNHAPGFSHP